MKTLRMAVLGCLCVLILAGHAEGLLGVYPAEFEGASMIDRDPNDPNDPNDPIDPNDGVTLSEVNYINRQAKYFLVNESGQDANEVDVGINIYMDALREDGSFCVNRNFEVVLVPATITPQSIYIALDDLENDKLMNPCTKDICLILADNILRYDDPNAALDLAQMFAVIDVTSGFLGETVYACQIYGQLYAEWAIAGLSPSERAMHSFNSLLLHIRYGVTPVFLNYVYQKLIHERRDPCAGCPEYCCSQICDLSVPFDFNGDGIIDENDLEDLTDAWLAALP